VQVFDSLDIDRVGCILPMDLEAFGQAVMPDATPDELLYFQVRALKASSTQI
jgi:hypothetical protein